MSFESYLDSFTWPLIEEVHADLFSSLDAHAQANFVEATQVLNIYSTKSILVLKFAKPVNDEKSRETYVPTECDTIVASSQKPRHISDLTRNEASFVLGSVLRSEKEYGLSPGWCIVQLSSAIPEGLLFLVFLINMKTYNCIWRCLLLGKSHANLDELQNKRSSAPVNKVWQFNPRVCWSYARQVSNIPCLFDTSVFLISAFILGLEF